MAIRIRPLLAFTVTSLIAAAPPAGAQAPFGRWEGTISHDDRNWPVRADVVPDGDAAGAYLDFPAYGLYYRRAEIRPRPNGVVIVYVSGRDTVVFDGIQRADTIAGRWTGIGVDAEFRLVRLGDAPMRLVEETVRFANGDVSLVGRLVKPAGQGPWPAIVWVHGSGPQSRDEDFYRDRAYLLARRGVAALIYDKRGVGGSTGDADATLDELAGDAVAAVRYLQGRPDIRGDHVGVGGFSQGGYVAPLAAARYGRIAFVAVGSAPGVTPEEQNDYAALTALQRAGFDSASVAEAMRVRRAVTRFQLGDGDSSAVAAEIESVRTRRWYRAADLPVRPVARLGERGRSVLRFDPLPVWSRVHVPVLAIWGAEDRLVPAERSRTAIERAMPPATRGMARLVVFPHASHGLLVVPPPGAGFDWPRLAPGFHELLADWIATAAKAR